MNMRTVDATLPPKLKNRNAQYAAWALALAFVTLALLQLVQFEKFVPFVESCFGSSGGAVGELIAVIVVISEIFALPFLLRMRLSYLMRSISFICSWVAVILLASLSFQVFSEGAIAVVSLPTVSDLTLASSVLIYGSAILLALLVYVSATLKSDLAHTPRK